MTSAKEESDGITLALPIRAARYLAGMLQAERYRLAKHPAVVFEWYDLSLEAAFDSLNELENAIPVEFLDESGQP